MKFLSILAAASLALAPAFASAGSDTDSHNVYFGTNPVPGAGELQGNQAGTSFDPGTLANATTWLLASASSRCSGGNRARENSSKMKL